ncbi:rod-binding protein [Patulibacter sp. SYSU D01012]|uniref:rod-binding protein n=1 Tax=Patulibacter sp. SYSU D01012 TaxID=2817381 RepID=UPI001B308FED|nr:rod-binding protein [Patulibacter sp. SYSU D01012]
MTVPAVGGAMAPVDVRSLPRDVRAGGPQAQKTYQAAVAFERVLVEQLTKELSATAQPADDETASAATGAYRDMLPGAMADALTGAGGIGLARQLYDAMRPSAATAASSPAPASGAATPADGAAAPAGPSTTSATTPATGSLS